MGSNSTRSLFRRSVCSLTFPVLVFITRIKKAQGLSSARASAMNKWNVENWFLKYNDILRNLGIENDPSKIWNLHESGLQDVFASKRAIGETGRSLYQVKAGEKRDTTTVLPVFNALGQVCPLMIIFKCKRLFFYFWQISYPFNKIWIGLCGFMPTTTSKI